MISLYALNDSLFDNLIFSCLVILLSGCIIQHFGSIFKPLEAFCNAITVYKSFYIKEKILYRDILENNIIIINPKKTNGFKSILIDKDLTKKIGKSGAQYQIGIIEFIGM